MAASEPIIHLKHLDDAGRRRSRREACVLSLGELVLDPLHLLAKGRKSRSVRVYYGSAGASSTTTSSPWMLLAPRSVRGFLERLAAFGVPQACSSDVCLLSFEESDESFHREVAMVNLLRKTLPNRFEKLDHLHDVLLSEPRGLRGEDVVGLRHLKSWLGL